MPPRSDWNIAGRKGSEVDGDDRAVRVAKPMGKERRETRTIKKREK